MRLSLPTSLRRITLAAALATPFAALAVTAGPGSWSAQQTWAADTVNGGNLTGYFYWPASQPVRAEKRALVLVLHGCGLTATNDVIEGNDGGFNLKAAADAYGAVILAPNATGNVGGKHCWDYANASTSRTIGHVGVLLDLVNRFKNNAEYAIDPDQVYVAGLSSGAGMTMKLACLAPDVFAGFGNNEGPPPGITTQVGYVPYGFTATTVANKCKALAGSNQSSFATQIAGAIWGTSDYVVAQAYGPMSMAAMRQVYGGSYTKLPSVSIPVGGSNTLYRHANGQIRTHEIKVTGLGHQWPAGPGGQNVNDVNNTTVNYPAVMMDFWFANNIRAAGGSEGTETSTTTTTTTTLPAGTCFNASNYAHVLAGRAYSSLGYAKANGSNQNMGFYNIFTTSKLRQTATNYYVVDATCP